MVTNKTLIFKKVPTGMPVAGEHLVVEDRGFDADAAPPAGGLTVALLRSSYDPYLRGKMRPENTASYSPAFPLDSPIMNDSIARVLQSDHADYAPGDVVQGYFPLAEYAVVPGDKVAAVVRRKIDNTKAKGLKELGWYLGPLGMPGLTTYSSLYEIGQPKKGETIFISSAAGAVGQLAGQLAKREGLKVIGSVGSDEKLDFILKDLGFDGGFNYKKEKPADALKRLAPDGIDIYFENVGGEHLEAAITAMNNFGRIIACGMISQYNKPPAEHYPIKNLMLIVAKRITFRGFIVADPGFGPKYFAEHQENVAKWLADGSLKAKIDVTDGIDKAAEGLIGLFEGKPFGKAVLKIRDE